ncbi:MAG: hypothetical protein WBG43_10155 [Marinifilaceae bacterium]
MTKEYDKIFRQLREKIKRIILSLKQIKLLLAQKELELAELLEENKKLKNENKDITDKYNILKIAKSLNGDNVDNNIAKDKINRMVKEIDKCISLLNN